MSKRKYRKIPLPSKKRSGPDWYTHRQLILTHSDLNYWFFNIYTGYYDEKHFGRMK